jgi:hypothetical protein
MSAPPPKFVSRCAASVGNSKSAALAAFAKVVVDRLRNQIANSTVFLGAQLLNERQFVGEKKDRRADQVHAGNFLPLTASRRMSCGQRFVQHDFVPRVDRVGNRFESSELENEIRGDRGWSASGCTKRLPPQMIQSQMQLLSRSPPGRREHERNHLAWVTPRRPFVYLSESGPGAHSVRMMKLFHLVTLVEGIINDFSF